MSALRQLLRPLVHLLLGRQVTYPLLKELLKEVYVDLADRDFTLPDRPQTATRIALLTGIHRKDVKRLRTLLHDELPAEAGASLGAQLVARWLGESPYLAPDGQPQPLARRGNTGESSFESLVASVSKDIRARAVLDEWLRLGVARLDEEDRVVLQVQAFVPEKGFDEKAFFFGRNVGDHVAAGARNLLGEGAPLLERAVYYDGLSQESVHELATLAEELGSSAIRQVNRRARELRAHEHDQRKSNGSAERMSFGVYFFRAPSESGDEDD
jgi:hypothetical protein